jgi:hypothetical protein
MRVRRYWLCSLFSPARIKRIFRPDLCPCSSIPEAQGLAIQPYIRPDLDPCPSIREAEGLPNQPGIACYATSA